MNSEHFSQLIEFNSALESANPNEFQISFHILKDSFVFKGHFPEQPILPGVVMVEILKRGLEISLGKEVKLLEATNFKFLKMINPLEVSMAQLHISIKSIENKIAVKGHISTATDTYFKASAQYQLSH